MEMAVRVAEVLVVIPRDPLAKRSGRALGRHQPSFMAYYWYSELSSLPEKAQLSKHFQQRARKRERYGGHERGSQRQSDKRG
ncbi:uncharacterized, partial [Tachysurus ichikawai]